MNKKYNNNLKGDCLYSKNRAVSPRRAQAREMNNEFNAVSVTSVTFESMPILLLIILKKMKFYVRKVTTCSFAFFANTRRTLLYPGPSFSRSCIFQSVLFLVSHFQKRVFATKDRHLSSLTTSPAVSARCFGKRRQSTATVLRRYHYRNMYYFSRYTTVYLLLFRRY